MGIVLTRMPGVTSGSCASNDVTVWPSTEDVLMEGLDWRHLET